MINKLRIIDIPGMKPLLKSFGKLVYIVEPVPYFNFSVGDVFIDRKGNNFKVKAFPMVNWKPEDIDTSSKFFVDFESKKGTTIIGEQLYRISDIVNKTGEARLCRCIDTPVNTRFVKDEIYRWGYIIDGKVAYHESGEKWDAGEIDFLWHFEILSGKH